MSAKKRIVVLVIDDDDDVRGSVCDALDDEGFEAVAAANGRRALERLRGTELSPDLILLDMMMPEMDGWAFRNELQKLPTLSGVPILIFTANNVLADSAENMQVSGVLRKPVRLEELLAQIRACLPPSSAPA